MNDLDIKEYFKKLNEIQIKLLEFIDEENNDEEEFKNLLSLFDEQKIKENKHNLKTILHLLTKIADNHHRTFNFFDKIEQILSNFQDEIKQNFTNFEIFNIFKSNKRILLFLFERQIITPDNSISNIIINAKYKKQKYPEFFFPEFKSFFSEKFCQEINYINRENQKNSELFEKNRKIGENNSYITEIIRNDSIEDFIVYINQKDLSLFSLIEPSIFETNLFLLKNKPSLIEYAAFFGSIQILKYLLTKFIKLTPSLWFYAIHSKNTELIHLLIENHIETEEDDIYIESIKCHHIDFMDYIKNNLLVIKDGKFFDFVSHRLKYFNFHGFVEVNHLDFKSNNVFFDLCQFDYFVIVEELIKEHEKDINARYIFKKYLLILLCFLIQFVYKIQ